MLNTLVGLGKEASGIRSIEEALTLHNMDWKVETRPTFFYKSDGEATKMQSSFVTVRTDTEEMLGKVGGDYVPMNNIEALKHVDALILSEAATLDSVFEIKGGKRVGASLRLNEKISIGGEDPVDLYIVVTTSHDGTRADRTEITPIRLWCTNQLALATREARQSWSVRHLSTMADNLKLVEEELKEVTRYSEWLKKMGEKLIAETMNELELTNALTLSLDFLRDERKKEKIVKGVIETFESSPLIGDDYRGTAWGGFNAVTEYFDHKRKYRNPTARYSSITHGVGARVRNSMAEILLAR